MNIGELTLNEHARIYPATPSRGKFHNIRINARKVLKTANVEKKCRVCSYDRYVEACHIKAIADFTGCSKISDINSLANLIYLCPNHHWELDHGLLKL